MGAPITAFDIATKKINELPGSAEEAIAFAALIADAGALWFIGDPTTGKLYKITKTELITILGQRFGIEDNLGVQDRSMDMQGHEFVVYTIDESDKHGELIASPDYVGFTAIDGANIKQLFMNNGQCVLSVSEGVDTEGSSFIKKDTLRLRVTNSFGSTDIIIDGTDTTQLPKISVVGLAGFADDAAAATGGIPVGGLYHTSGTVKIRLA